MIRSKVDAVVRARMRSSRFPGKVLMQAAGRPLLLHLLERLGQVQSLGNIVVATSEDASDNPIYDLCLEEDISCFRGRAEDVLDRNYQCAHTYEMKHVAILTADNPLIDPGVCGEVIEAYTKHSEDYDYVSNCHPATFPDGQEIEICSLRTLQIAWEEAHKPFQREHVTPFIWDQPERFRCLNVTLEPDLHRERWTLDYPEDYEFIRAVFEGLYPVKSDFSMWDIIAFLDTHSELRRINAAHSGYTWHTSYAEDLKTIQNKAQ